MVAQYGDACHGCCPENASAVAFSPLACANIRPAYTSNLRSLGALETEAGNRTILEYRKTVTILEDLQARGLIHQIADHEEAPLAQLLETPQSVYAGFDPTAPSLHVGNLIPLLGLRRFQEAGHRAIPLAGGATGMVGDPSGRSSERILLSEDELRANIAGIRSQLEQLLDFSNDRAILVDNLDWTREVHLLPFLRDTGKHFSINAMLRKDSVQGRLEREGEGISYTEFSYMLLQAFDFQNLYENYDCRIQIGGSDQWGNITAGTELIRKKLGQRAYGVTFPLLTNADGSKFGKTAEGSVWLDPNLTSPYAFRQFWYNTDDADLVSRLKSFTFLPLHEIEDLASRVDGDPNAVRRVLAREMTTLVHGREEAERVERAATVLFSKDADLNEIPVEYLADAFSGAPVTELPRGWFVGDGTPFVDLAVRVIREGDEPISKGAARRLIEQNSLALNGRKISNPFHSVTVNELLHDRYLVVRKGKRHDFLGCVIDD